MPEAFAPPHAVLRWRVGVDIGGTFTDIVALGPDGTLLRGKVASTPRNPEAGYLAAFSKLLAGAFGRPLEPGDVAFVGHATTIATNALLGQTNLPLARVAFVTTEGFRDVLEIGRQNRSALYDLEVTRATPLARREDRLTVLERLGPAGETLVPLDPASLERAVATIAERGIASVAVGFLHADVDGRHERAARDAIAVRLPNVEISLSSEVDPQYREYERFSTTVVNAALAPISRAYLSAIGEGTRALGVAAPLHVMRSDGGMATLEHAAARPAALLESGPASGVIGAAKLGTSLGLRRVLSFDMGGTTAKAGTIVDGAPERHAMLEAAGTTHSGRAVSGSGYPVRFPFLDLAEVSAGGGTIAHLDAAGTLRVGPVSAGADPGPACYGRGEQPTVTDADLVLGRLGSALLGGNFTLDVQRARRAIASVAAPFDGDVERTAAAIVALVDAQMAKVLRIVTVERGYDPRDFTLVAFGGSGPLHACAVAGEIGIRHIVVPPNPGVFSAFALLVANMRTPAQRSFVRLATESEWQAARALANALQAETNAALAAQAVSEDERRFTREFDLRYAGQSSELTVSDPADLAAAVAGFHERHRVRFGYAVCDEPVEFVTVRVVGTSADVAYPVSSSSALVPSGELPGPATIALYDATVYVAPGWSARSDDSGALRMDRAGT